jgi:hypothetical protein
LGCPQPQTSPDLLRCAGAVKKGVVGVFDFCVSSGTPDTVKVPRAQVERLIRDALLCGVMDKVEF